MSETPTQKLVEATARIAELETQVNGNADLVAKLNAAVAERDQALANLDSATQLIAELEQKQIDVDAEVEARASIRAQEILATTGLAAPIKAAQADAPKSAAEWRAAYDALPNSRERAAFWAQHKDQILR